MYLRAGTAVIPVDIVNGVPLTTIDMGGASGPIADWTWNNGFLYVMMPGAGAGPFSGPLPPSVNVIDTTAQMSLFPTPVGLGVSGPASLMRFGPGTTGPSLFVMVPGAALLMQLNPASLVATVTIPISTGLTEMELSPGGTEWLLLCNSGPCGAPLLETMNPSTLSINPVTQLIAPIQLLVSLPSTTLRKCYVVHNNDTVVPFATDPAAVSFLTSQLPISSGNLRVDID
jgi:hypothetical protein